MSNYVRLNLASAILPFSVAASGRTVMLPDNDENFDRYNAANTTPDKGVPQVFYMHNIMPTSGGFQSIGYIQQLPGLPGQADFDTCFSLINSDNSSFLFSPASGMNYIFDGDVGTWASYNPIVSSNLGATTLVTTAYVNGQTYIYYAGIGCYLYSNSTKQIVPITLTGLNTSQVLGICAANGYMIAWTSNTVAWSSTTNPTNFVPNINTGAGGGTVQDAKGPINFCCSISGGFLIYCEKNVVGATYTANVGFPYIILEVVGSGGVASIDQVAYQGNLTYHVAMTSAGIQQISLNAAIPTLPEVSEFLTSQLFEDFDETALSFSETYVGAQLAVKFASVSDRFVVISYGISVPNFTHAIVYDIALNRFGKLKLAHRGCFSFIAPAPYGLVTYAQLMNTPISSLNNVRYEDLFTSINVPVTPKQNLAFIQRDGTIQLVDFQVSEANANGVLLLGRYQYHRGNMIVHQRTDVELQNPVTNMSLYLLPSFDGKNFTSAVTPAVNKAGGLEITYARRFTAANISLLLKGAFAITTVIINFTVGGSR
jgi:hypothetical protein